MSERPTPEESWDRLRAADPVAGSDPDLTALRARVLAAIPADAATSAGTRTVAGRGVRRRHLLQTAAAVAAVAAAAATVAAGFAWGRASAPEVTAAARLPMAVVGGAPGAAAGGAGGGGGGSAPAGSPAVGAPAPAAAESAAAAGSTAVGADKLMAYPGWRTLLDPAPGLSDQPGTATGYRYDATGVDRRALVRRLAEVLGVSGRAGDDGAGGWIVGPTDGTGPAVSVGADPMAWWWFNDPQAAPWGYCPAPEPVGGSDAGAAGSTTTSDEPAMPTAEPVPCTTPQGPVPGAEAAEQQARRIVQELGVDPAGFVWQTSGDDLSRTVTAVQAIDGQQTAQSWSFSYGPGGNLFSANGFAATPVALPGYQVVGARTAVLRSQDPRWTSLGPVQILPEGQVWPLAADSGVARGNDATDPSAAPTPTPLPTGPGGLPQVTLTLDRATITGAEPGLAQYWAPNAELLLLPAYVLTADDGRAWSMVSVADAYVAFVAP